MHIKDNTEDLMRKKILEIYADHLDKSAQLYRFMVINRLVPFYNCIFCEASLNPSNEEKQQLY